MEDDNLPVLHESERELSAVERMRAELAQRDGYLSPSNATVPKEAVDIEGDKHPTAMDATPRAEALGYATANVDEVVEFEGSTYLADGRMGPTAEIGIDSENFIEDVTDWA